MELASDFVSRFKNFMAIREIDSSIGIFVRSQALSVDLGDWPLATDVANNLFVLSIWNFCIYMAMRSSISRRLS